MTDTDLGKNVTCLIIAPIGSRLDARGTEGRARYEESTQMWEEVFEPACAVFGIEPIRADKIADPGDITEQIFQLLKDADIVIADFSGANPNVMYELGLRHSRNKVTIQVGEHSRLPFDVNTIRTVQFRRTEAGLLDLRNSLEESIRAALLGKWSAVAATRLWNDSASINTEVVQDARRRSNAPDDEGIEVDEPGIVDLLAEGEEGLGQVTDALGEATALLVSIGHISTEATSKLHDSDAANRGFAGRLIVVRGMAADLHVPSMELEAVSDRYFEALIKTDVMVQFIFSRLEQEEEERKQATDYLKSLIELIDAAEQSAVNISDFARSGASLRQTGRDLAAASKMIERSGNRLLEGIAIISSWRDRIEKLLAEAVKDEEDQEDPKDDEQEEIEEN